MGYYGAVKSNEAIADLGANRLPSVQSLLTISENAGLIKAAQRTLLSPDLSQADRLRQPETVAKATAAYEAAWKIYEPLPQTAEEAATWKEFVPAWEQWRKDNDEFFKMNSELEALAIQNPQALQRDLQQFIGDHYKLDVKILGQVENGAECKGGDDPTACNFGKWLAKFETTNPELKQIIDATRPSHNAFHAAVKEAKELAAKGDKDGALKLIHGDMEKSAEKTFEGFSEMLAAATKATELREKMNYQLMTVCYASQKKAIALLDKLVEINEKVAATTTKTSASQAAALKLTSLAAMIAVVVAALALGFFITQGINKVLNRISDTLSDGAAQTASAAGQVSSSSQSLAEGASEQASSLEETSSSLEEMASMTKRNAENARQANDIAKQAREAADKGAGDMQTMSAAMEAIKVSSNDIAKIIKTIDEIAFQTNILALNAAVEAARAGEAGMGFAVVADEVRNLAQRSATAAKETADKIEGAINKTSQGVEISGKVAQALNEIVTKVRQVDELVTEVAGASREQTDGIAQINTAVGQMDKVTQSNAANAEESAAAAEELNAQAEAMKQSVAELLQLVGGQSGPAAKKPTAHVQDSKETPAAVSAAKRPALINGNGHCNGQISAVRSKATAANRRDEIPLESDFKDF